MSLRWANWAAVCAILASVAGAVTAQTMRPVARASQSDAAGGDAAAATAVVVVRPSGVISTMSAPPTRNMAAISDLPLFVEPDDAPAQTVPFLPPNLPLRGPGDAAFVPAYSVFAAATAMRPPERPRG